MSETIEKDTDAQNSVKDAEIITEDKNTTKTNEHKKDAKCSCAKTAVYNAERKSQKKIKNLIAVIVLLTGALIGSLFLDFAQMVRGEGFSQKALRDAKVVEYVDQTWVAYDDPKVTVRVFTADDCASCVTDEVLVWLRRIIPTIEATQENINEDILKKEAEDYGIEHIPAFIFSQEIEDTDFFRQAEILFEKNGDEYILKTAQLGVPVGEYITSPTIGDAISVGEVSAPITIIEYSDFECPFCKVLHPVVEEALKEYGDKINYVYKHLPLPDNERSIPAAIAAECAHQQGEFLPYANILFSRQAQWSKQKTDFSFNSYARELGLDRVAFAACLTDEKHTEKISSERDEAIEYGLTGTPTLFVNDQFSGGVITYEELREMIEVELSNYSEHVESKEDEGSSSVQSETVIQK